MGGQGGEGGGGGGGIISMLTGGSMSGGNSTGVSGSDQVRSTPGYTPTATSSTPQNGDADAMKRLQAQLQLANGIASIGRTVQDSAAGPAPAPMAARPMGAPGTYTPTARRGTTLRDLLGGR